MPAKHTATSVLADLKRRAKKSVRDGMARYGLPSDNALGVSVGTMKAMAKTIGRDHKLALDLWKTGVYEARMMAAFVDEPERVTIKQMDDWCRDFDNWGICDTVLFSLFDRSPLAWGRVRPWIKKKPEFEKRAGFVMMACLAGHDKQSPDSKFLPLLPLIEKGADDERNFVKKGVSWALRMIGRRSALLYAAALPVAERLAESTNAAARWVGHDARRDLLKPLVRSKFA